MTGRIDYFEDSYPSTADLEGDNPFAKAARKHWLERQDFTSNGGQATSSNSSLPKFKGSTVDDIYKELDSANTSFKSLLILENLQYLEKYLWPNFDEDSTDVHVVSISLMVAVKKRQGLHIWDLFRNSSQRFEILFKRVLTMLVGTTTATEIRQHLLSFVSCSFQSLDSTLIRRACAPLVSIGVLHHLHSDETRELLFTGRSLLQKSWKAANKRYSSSDDSTKSNIKFEWSWLPVMILNFLNIIYDYSDEIQNKVLYSERFLEFLTDLVSQAPTRRHVNPLLMDMNVMVALRLSPMYLDKRNRRLKDMAGLLETFMRIPIDEETGIQMTRDECQLGHHELLSRLQRIALKKYKEKLTILALSNFGALKDEKELASHLENLDEQELHSLCTELGVRTSYPPSVNIRISKIFLLKALLFRLAPSNDLGDIVHSLTVLPTEVCLYDQSLLQTERYRGDRPLPLPKVNLQYLSTKDFLYRSFMLYRTESFFDIRKDIEESISRLYPAMGNADRKLGTRGSLKMALPISRISILEIAPAKVGENFPAYVRAEIELPLESMPDQLRKGWEELRPDDVVFFVSVDPKLSPQSQVPKSRTSMADNGRLHPQMIRSAEIMQVLDKAGNIIYNFNNSYRYNRKLHVKFDGRTYQNDSLRESNIEHNVYAALNVLVRRKGVENNFKAVLDSIRFLINSEVPIPDWLLDVFLGYGDPWRAHFTRLNFRPKSIDFVDTFLDWDHLNNCFPGRISSEHKCDPPFVLAESTQLAETRKSKKKAKFDDLKSLDYPLNVSTYKVPSRGPYTIDTPKRNSIKFTTEQAKAIYSGTNPGLTIIVGPPGTGKTDVACQIISNIYHNFPMQRTLLVAHSNQALNQVFQKISVLDIDRRHLLRLGHGEETLISDASFSKSGRVESFMENRAYLLSLVDRLALAIGAPGAHGNSCETAGYFFRVYVQPTWDNYLDTARNGATVDAMKKNFPFLPYFSERASEMLQSTATVSDILEVANSCFNHIKKIFIELEDILPFEILRSSKDKANYLLVKEARIIAMTSTHAAIKRNEISKLGFKYDNVIMEEAAQITEIETFIPLTLQTQKGSETSLQRVVLCGDHLQNSPIVQNIAVKQFSNLEQSMFARMVRLGVPTINLDRQGRARPSIAELYRWRYKNLGNLESIVNDMEFQLANSGFRYEFQFINVGDFKGQGETEPSPHFLQNLGEAEYAVAIFQYMRLLGYPAERITIMTTYAGQRQLIKDVLYRRCAKNPLFGVPAYVTTVDKYQGEQNDYIILSLVRTKRVGYLRDIRRLTVALSRARLGLYIVGRRNVFETCYELSTPFKLLLSRPDALQLVTKEMWPPKRRLEDAVDSIEMKDVEHLGQYVFEMTNVKVKAMDNGTRSQ